MSTEQVLDAEDQMAQALAELRQDKVDALTAPEPAATPAPAQTPAAIEPHDAADAPKDNPSGQKPPANTTAEDPAETLRKTREELHKAQSDLGRVGALNRRYNETRAQLEQVIRENETLKSAKPVVAVSAAGGGAADKLAELSEKVKDFPELHGLVTAVSESLKEVDARAAAAAQQAAAHAMRPMEALRLESEQRRQLERDAAYEAALNTFQGAYPNAVDVIKSPDFNAWISLAPKQVQDAFRNGSTPDEAMAVMDAFDAHTRRSGKPSIAQSSPSPTPAAPDTATQRTSNAARLNSAAGLPSRASGAKGGMPPEDDFEASLEFFRKKRIREAQAANPY